MYFTNSAWSLAVLALHTELRRFEILTGNKAMQYPMNVKADGTTLIMTGDASPPSLIQAFRTAAQP